MPVGQSGYILSTRVEEVRNVSAIDARHVLLILTSAMVWGFFCPSCVQDTILSNSANIGMFGHEIYFLTKNAKYKIL